MPECFRAVAASSAASSAPRVRILAYGDSLTAGFCDRGRKFSPYGAALVEALAPEFDAEVWVCGLSGMLAEEMMERLRRKVLRDRFGRQGKGLQYILAEDGKFDLVIIMAGTNDLATPCRAADVCNSVQALHGACHEFGLRTVALSVPHTRILAKVLEAEAEQKKVHSARRAYAVRWRDTNDMLQKWATGPGEQDGVVHFVDTSTVMPFSEDSGCWEEDGLHFSPQGSRHLGEALASQLALVLREVLSTGPCAPCLPAPRWQNAMPDRFATPPLALAAAAAAPLERPLAVPEGSDSGGRKRRRILAYGDSLTAGYWANGVLFAPYAETLVRALAPELEVEAWVCGLSGMTAEEMAEGLDDDCLRDCVRREGRGLRRILREEREPFDLALLMAGTNDLGACSSPLAIVKELQKLHEACHAEGVHTVALSVPTSKFAALDVEGEAQRRKVNKWLAEWAGEASSSQAQGARGGVLCVVDTVDLLPYSRDRGLWELDGLHFSKAGSQQFGRRLAEKLRQPLLDLQRPERRRSPSQDGLAQSAPELAAPSQGEQESSSKSPREQAASFHSPREQDAPFQSPREEEA